MTSAEIPSEVERRRASVGAALRGLRAAAGISGPRLAEMSGVAQSQISRIERGRITPHEGALGALLDALRVPQAKRDDLLEELRALRAEYASWQLLTEPGGGGRRQREIAEIESQTTLTREFEPTMVPGLLQTAAYARAVFSSWPNIHDQDRVPDAIRARMDRQTSLFEEGRSFQFILMEQALWLSIAPPDVMAGQFDRVAQLATLPAVEVRVVPLGTPLSVCPLNSFAILDETIVMIDLVASAVTLRAKRDIASYIALFERLRDASLSPEETVPWLHSHAVRYVTSMRASGR